MRTFAVIAMLVLIAASPSFAEQWTGWITDEKCAAAGKYTGGEHQACLQSGSQIVFVNDSDKKVYKLSDGEKAKGLLGRKASVSGTAKGDTIEVENMTEAASQ